MERLYLLHFVPRTDEASAVAGVNVLAHWANRLSIADRDAISRFGRPIENDTNLSHGAVFFHHGMMRQVVRGLPTGVV